MCGGNHSPCPLGPGHTRSIPACAGEPCLAALQRRWRRVYPRVCGGTIALHSIALPVHGLSPRVRGNRVPLGYAVGRGGSIPACAGEPGDRVFLRVQDAVYPRVCGGTRRPCVPARAGCGLSPRVRGNRYGVTYAEADARSIPACAGEPGLGWAEGIEPTVYPRVCGGTPIRSMASMLPIGLSPRVRGNRRNSVRRRRVPRSIPACAGEPGRSPAGRGRRGVYPRVCGGTWTPRPPPPISPGLSPRVRGNHASPQGRSMIMGSIPACAGEPIALGSLAAFYPVYPRVCGGTRLFLLRRAGLTGLSPRVRGNPCRRPAGRSRDGSIPACAGEPRNLRNSGITGQVYPRVCGGTDPPGWSLTGLLGLSPRVRGNPRRKRVARHSLRSIPACAGEPRRRRQASPNRGVYPRVCGGT